MRKRVSSPGPAGPLASTILNATVRFQRQLAGFVNETHAAATEITAVQVGDLVGGAERIGPLVKLSGQARVEEIGGGRGNVHGHIRIVRFVHGRGAVF